MARFGWIFPQNFPNFVVDKNKRVTMGQRGKQEGWIQR